MDPFRVELEVRFGDVDPARIVYYPRYLHLVHVAFEEFWACALGLPYADVIDGRKVAFPAVRLEVDFASPLRFGDRAVFEVAVERLGRSSIVWRYRVFTTGDDPVGSARITTVTVATDSLETIATPDWLRRLLEGHLVDPAGEPAAG